MSREEKDLMNEFYFILAEIRALAYEKDSAELFLQKASKQLAHIEEKLDEMNKRVIKIGEQVNQAKK